MIPIVSPAAIVAPARIVYAIVVYGDEQAMIAVKKNADTQGAVTSWAKLGTSTFALFIVVAKAKPSESEQAFIDDVNRKKFGDLTAGFATLGPGR